MRKNRLAGTTLIEILVVIVVFLVGILALVQVFPPGLKILTTTRSNTQALQLGEAETQRILGRSGQLAQMIVPVTYQTTAQGIRYFIDTGRMTGNLMPPKDPGVLPGRLDSNGNVIVGGVSIGNWERTSGSNLFSRVMGESGPVPAPRQVPGMVNGFGGVYDLTFGPAYYFPTPSGIGESGVVVAYGNDYVRRFGDREANVPNPFGRWRENEFYFVADEDTDTLYFPGDDQIWIAPSNRTRTYRISYGFAYDNQGRTEQFDIVDQITLDPLNPPPSTLAVQVGSYWVISLKQLVAQPDIYGNSFFNAANFLYTERSSVNIQRTFDEIPVTQVFNQNDPYEYKVLGTGTDTNGQGFCMGTLLFNPTGYGTRVRSNQGTNQALLARLDYTVFDWRLIKDEFRVPRPELAGSVFLPNEVKLTLNAIKTLGSQGPDLRSYTGTGLSTPTLTALGAGLTDDMVMVDTDTGAIILGNKGNNPNAPGYPQFPDSAWWADKSLGHLVFRDVDGDPSNGLSAYLSYPTGDPTAPWSAKVLVPDITNHAVRVIYQGKNEWSVQPFKAARTYRVSGYIGAGGLSPGVCFVGGALDNNGNPLGQDHRLYFPPYDLSQKVIVGELWLTQNGGQPFALYDQEFQIAGIENVNGVDLAFADIFDKAPGGHFDWSQGYSVRRIKGASLKVRVMWNPTTFELGADEVKNYDNLEIWMRQWRRTENESLQIGGRN